MKKFALIAVLAFAGSNAAYASLAAPASSETPCTGGAAAKVSIAGGPGTPYTTAGSFVKTGFDIQCSSNTYVTFSNASGTLFTVGSSSAKGNQSFKGSSNGGAVVVHAKCAADPCVQQDATTADTAASSM